MKVAYNGCFGGFGLSVLALTRFAEMKGISLTWYHQTGYRHNGDESYVKVNIDDLGKVSSFSHYAMIKDLGDVIDKLPTDMHYYPSFYEDESRCDPHLIEVIETLGKAANGMCASLLIAEIPDGVSFEITEYDGNEDVVPPRQSW